MAKHHKAHHGKHHGKHHKKHGGREMGHSEQEHPMVASGNPNVIKEAEEHKHGGRAKHHMKKHHRAKGGSVTKSVGTFMTGGGVRPRLDRPGRKSGGRVGSDTSPLTSAHHARSPESSPKTQEGGMSS